jgi:hypothetical protein
VGRVDGLNTLLKALIVATSAACFGSWVGDQLFFPSRPLGITLIWTTVGSFLILTTGYGMFRADRSRLQSYLLLLPLALVGGIILLLPFSLVPEAAGIGMVYAAITYVGWVAVHAVWTFAQITLSKEVLDA